MNNKTKNLQDDYFRELVNPYVLTAGEYPPPPDCGDEIIKLSANENDFGAAPAIYQAVRQELDINMRLNRYPDSSCSALRKALSGKFGLAPDYFIVGNGLDDVIGMFAMTFLDRGDDVLMPAMTFGVYESSAAFLGACAVKTPMRGDLSIDVDAMIDSVTDRTKMVFLCTPNNPTGTIVAQDELERLLKKLDSLSTPPLLIVDQAYSDFMEPAEPPDYHFDVASLIDKRSYIVVLRTFSKISGLAGLRVGYAAAHPELLAYVNRVRPPFTVNSLAQAAALADICDPAVGDFKDIVRESVAKSREDLGKFFDKAKIKYAESRANFIFAFYDKDYTEILDISHKLLKSGILVRTLKHDGAPSGIRFTIGTEGENRRLIEELGKILS